MCVNYQKALIGFSAVKMAIRLRFEMVSFGGSNKRHIDSENDGDNTYHRRICQRMREKNGIERNQISA